MLSQVPIFRHSGRLPRHAALRLPKLALPGQQFLPLLVDLALDLDLDLAQLLLLPSQLFLLQPDALAGEIFGVHGGIEIVGSALHALGQLLGTVILVEEIVRDFLQVREVGMQQRAADGEEVAVAWVVDLDDPPGILAGADAAAANLDDFLGADDGEGHEASKLGVLFHRVFVVFFNVVGEIVHGDAVVLDVFHDEFLGFGELGGGQGVGFADDGNYVDAGGEALH